MIAPSDATSTVLIVDDDPDMRLLVRILLEASRPDLTVVGEAVDGDDALAVWDRLDAPPVPHLVVLDNKMPGRSGLEVAEQMLARVPSQRIVLFSAYINDDMRADASRLGIRALLRKDDVNELPALLHSMLD